MPDAPIATPPADPAGNPAPADAGATPPAEPAAPKWEGDFDPERAARLVANLREEIAGLKTKNTETQAKLTQFEQAQMSDLEKVTSRATSAESELSKVRRELFVRDALTDYKLPKDAARFLTGETADEINDAAKAFAALSGAKPAGQGDALPPTLPIPGNGSDPAAVSQLTREQAEKLPPAELMKAYREGRLRSIGGR